MRKKDKGNETLSIVSTPARPLALSRGRWSRRALGLAWKNKSSTAGSAFAWVLGGELLNLISTRLLGGHLSSLGFLVAFLLWPALALAGSRAFVDANNNKPVVFADFWTGIGLPNVGRSMILGVINVALGIAASIPLLVAMVDMKVPEHATVQEAKMAFMAPTHLALIGLGAVGTWALASVFWGLVWRAPARLARGMTLWNALRGSVKGFWQHKKQTLAATGGLFAAIALCWLGMVVVLMLALIVRQHLGVPNAGPSATNASGLVGAGAAILLFVTQIGVFFASFWVLAAMWGAPALAEEEHAELQGEAIPTALPT